MRGTRQVFQSLPKNETRTEAPPQLFDFLRALRKELATRDQVPPYLIFSDATLRDMASVNPKNLDEMLEVKGVGEMKLQKYGQDFLDCILEHQTESK